MRSLTPLSVLLLIGLASSAAAQEAVEEPAGPVDESAPPPPKTVPNDLGFGEQRLHERFHFPDASRHAARVDRRDAIDASSDRTIVWPTAHTPHKHTLAISNHMLVMTQLSYSPSDDAQLTATLVLPLDVADMHVALSSKFTLHEGDSHVFSIQPFGQFRRGARDLGASDLGFGVAALLDVMSTNDLVITLGAVAYGSVLAITQELTEENCASREDYLLGNCRDAESTSTVFPSGGHFVGVQAGLSWYIFDSWSLRGELMTGYAAGSVMGSEWLTRGVDSDDERERILGGTGAAGIPFDTDAALGLGLQWSNGTVAAQFSGYGLRAPAWWANEGEDVREVYFVPMFNAGLAVF